MANNNNRILLKSNDDETFEVDRSVIRLSTTLNTMFQGFLFNLLWVGALKILILFKYPKLKKEYF